MEVDASHHARDAKLNVCYGLVEGQTHGDRLEVDKGL